MNDLDYLYAHHAVGLCPEERCVAARANLAALVEAAQEVVARWLQPNLVNAMAFDDAVGALDDALQGRVASREGSGT